MIILRNSIQLKQKEYNIIDDTYRSGIKRAYKKTIGNFRRNTAKRLTDSIKSDINQVKESSRKLSNSSSIQNKSVENNLIKEASKEGIIVSNVKVDNTKGNYLVKDVNDQDLIEYSNNFGNKKEDVEKLKNQIKKSHKFISHPENSGSEKLAHEIGHVKNEKGIISKQISKIANSEKTRSQIRSSFNKVRDTGDDGSLGVKESAKRFVRAKAVELEENNANRKGLKLLKKSGASKEELNKARDNYKEGSKSYKHSGNVSWKTSLRNTVQIPSRRKK